MIFVFILFTVIFVFFLFTVIFDVWVESVNLLTNEYMMM